MTTYSLSGTGYITGPVLGNKNYDIPDLSSSGIVVGTNDQNLGGRQQAMQIGDPMLVLCADGTSRWMKIDAERSTITNTVLIPAGP